MYLWNGLGNSFMEPVDAPDPSKFRVADMYKSCTDQEVNFHHFKSIPTPIRIVCATVAFCISQMLGK